MGKKMFYIFRNDNVLLSLENRNSGFTYNTNNNGKHSNRLSSSDFDGSSLIGKREAKKSISRPVKQKSKHNPILSPTARKAANAKLMKNVAYSPVSDTSSHLANWTKISSVSDSMMLSSNNQPNILYTNGKNNTQRTSYKKAIQKAGYNMNDLVSTNVDGPVASTSSPKEFMMLNHVDWTENAISDHHIWSSTNVSGDLCYVGEEHCQKSGPRKRCSACHVVVHENCVQQFEKIGFPCKTTFREFTSKSMRESLIVHHHWVHRRKLEGKCKQCGKSFEKRFGFRETTKIIAISCSWCKDAYHNKVQCFQLQRINEPCTLGIISKSIVPSTWIIKSSKQKSLRNRSKKRRSSSGTTKKRSSKENRLRTFLLRPLSQQAAFVCPILVFINPKSGGRQGHKLLQSFQWLLNPRQVFDLTKGGPLEALDLYRKVPNLRILACGGDGTVGWILSVLDKLNITKPPPVAILPLGTGNDLSRTLNFGHGYTDEPISKIIQGVEEARTVKLDRWKLTVEKNEDAVFLNEDDEIHSSIVSSDDQTYGAGSDQPPLDVINNYFSIGSDAQVALNFHESREAHPGKFTSRIGNKIFYARASVLEYLTRQSKNLSKHITVECDGEDITSKIRALKPVCILFLNIPRYSSGTTPWGNPTAGDFKMQRHDDKLIEVLAFSLNQLGMLFVGGHGERLRQCKSAIIRTTKTFPVQIDGEPCKLNPSIIKLNFFNQANMLCKLKRRISATQEFFQPTIHEQIKIRVNVVKKKEFDEVRGSKELLCGNATPLIVTVVMNQSTLDTVRSCLSLIISEIETSASLISEKWFFLDASNPDHFYKIDKNRESHLIVSEVVTADREVYILDIPDESKTFSLLNSSSDKYSLLRNRIQSDSGLLHSISSSYSTSTQQSSSLIDDLQSNGMDGSTTSLPSVPSSAVLDVVFELPEVPAADVNPDHALAHFSKTKLNSIGDFDNEELVHLSGNNQTPVLLPALSRVQLESSHLDSDSTTYSTSSNEYVLTDHSSFPSPSKQQNTSNPGPNSNISPIDFSLPPLFTRQMSLEENKVEKIKSHKKTWSDTDPRKTIAFHLSPSQLISTMRHNKNQSNNIKSIISPLRKTVNISKTPTDHRFSKETNGIFTMNNNCGLTDWDRRFLESSKRGDMLKMKEALVKGALLNARDEDGYTALHHAVNFSQPYVFDFLISSAGSFDLLDEVCNDKHQTALHLASWFGKVEMCEKLIKAGASFDILDHKGHKAIDKARQSNSMKTLNLFQDYLDRANGKQNQK